MKTLIAAAALMALTSPAFAQDDPYAYGAPYHEPYQQQSDTSQPDYGYQDQGMGQPGVSPTPWQNGGMHGSCIGYVCY